MTRPSRRARLRFGLLCAALLCGGVAHAADLSDAEAKKLFNRRGCNACHGVDELRIGPSYRDIAQRYDGDPAAGPDWLARKIIAGGAGSWGFVPMIGYPSLPAQEARAMARWIQNLSKAEPAS